MGDPVNRRDATGLYSQWIWTADSTGFATGGSLVEFADPVGESAAERFERLEATASVFPQSGSSGIVTSDFLDPTQKPEGGSNQTEGSRVPDGTGGGPSQGGQTGGGGGGSSGHGSGGNQPAKVNPACAVPTKPTDVNVDANIKLAQDKTKEIVDNWALNNGQAELPFTAVYVETLAWFYSQVRNKGPMDYKQDKSGNYQDFGNFNFGVVGSAAGLSESILLRAAGWAQIQAGTSRRGWGSPFGRPPYGDDPSDQKQIIAGFGYYKAVSQGQCK